MECVDAAAPAEIVLGRESMELVQAQKCFSAQQAKMAFVNPQHEGVSAPANGTVAGSQFLEVAVDFKTDLAAMTAPNERLECQIEISPVM